MHIIPVMPTRGFPWHAPLFWVSWHFYPMDSGPLSAAAQSSMHLMIVFFFVCRDLVESWRNPIRSITSRCPIAQNHEKAMVIISFLTIACHQAPGSPIEIMTGGLSRTHNCTIKKHMNIYVERQGDTHKWRLEVHGSQCYTWLWRISIVVNHPPQTTTSIAHFH